MIGKMPPLNLLTHPLHVPPATDEGAGGGTRARARARRGTRLAHG